jgi:hypothetical protein
MKAVTIETYFEILEKCSLEAFESLKLKNYYPKNGEKAIWDVSTLTIGTPWSRSTPEQNAITRTMYIKDNLSDTFLIALESYCKDFETKRLVTRAYFYKKCYEALLYKVTQSELWNKPDFGFNIDLEPCTLTFIWSMRRHIQWRSEVPEINSVEKYNPFYRQRQFTDFVNKTNDDKTQNIHYLGNYFAEWKERQNKTVSENESYSLEVQENLKSYNWNIYDLMNEVIQLYKGVNENDNNTIHIQEGKIEFRLTEIKNFSKIVKHYKQNRKYNSAIEIKGYCELIFDEAISNLKEIYSIDILKSPLKTNLEAVTEALNNSINIDEVLKLQALYKSSKVKETETEISQPQQPNQRTANFDPNHFNQKSYDLFLYLVEYYTKEGKVKYSNIFEFMRKSIDKNKYVFRFTQEQYRAFLLSNYGIVTAKIKVAAFLYEDEEKPALNSHEQQFDGR